MFPAHDVLNVSFISFSSLSSVYQYFIPHDGKRQSQALMMVADI